MAVTTKCPDAKPPNRETGVGVMSIAPFGAILPCANAKVNIILLKNNKYKGSDQYWSEPLKCSEAVEVKIGLVEIVFLIGCDCYMVLVEPVQPEIDQRIIIVSIQQGEGAGL